MQNNLILSALIAFLFFLGKTLEIKFITRGEYQLKTVMRDVLIVYISCVGGLFLLDQINIINKIPPTKAFTSNPEF